MATIEDEIGKYIYWFRAEVKANRTYPYCQVVHSRHRRHGDELKYKEKVQLRLRD
jgi:hypothetical protein